MNILETFEAWTDAVVSGFGVDVILPSIQFHIFES